MAKQVVPFKLVDINTEQFATFEENFDPASSQLSIDFGVDFKLDRDQNLLGVFTRYDFSQEEKILVMECACSFHFSAEYWSSRIEGKTISFSPTVLTHLLVLSVGTARGIIHAKKPKKFQHLLLPTMNVSKILVDDLVFSLEVEEEE